MKRTGGFVMGDPRDTKHLDLGGGFHLIHNPKLKLFCVIVEPTSGGLFDFSANPRMSKEEARRTVYSIADATPAQKQTYLALLDGEHLKREGVTK